MYLHTEWELELNAAPQADKRRANLFNVPFSATIKNKGQDIINLGYWNPLFLPADNTDKIVSFSVPLADKNDNPYGVCGLELSRSFFEKLVQH